MTNLKLRVAAEFRSVIDTMQPSAVMRPPNMCIQHLRCICMKFLCASELNFSSALTTFSLCLLIGADEGRELLVPRSPDVPVQALAKVNCPEKIVICIDISSEMNDKRYRAKAGNSFSGLCDCKLCWVGLQHRWQMRRSYYLWICVELLLQPLCCGVVVWCTCYAAVGRCCGVCYAMPLSWVIFLRDCYILIHPKREKFYYLFLAVASMMQLSSMSLSWFSTNNFLSFLMIFNLLYLTNVNELLYLADLAFGGIGNHRSSEKLNPAKFLHFQAGRSSRYRGQWLLYSTFQQTFDGI